MPSFGVTGDKRAMAEMHAAAERYYHKGFSSVLFEGGFWLKGDIWVVILTPRLPRLDFIGYAMIGASWVFQGITWLSWFFLIPGLIAASMTFFWFQAPYIGLTRFMLWRSARGCVYEVHKGEDLLRRIVE